MWTDYALKVMAVLTFIGIVFLSLILIGYFKDPLLLSTINVSKSYTYDRNNFNCQNFSQVLFNDLNNKGYDVYFAVGYIKNVNYSLINISKHNIPEFNEINTYVDGNYGSHEWIMIRDKSEIIFLDPTIGSYAMNMNYGDYNGFIN